MIGAVVEVPGAEAGAKVKISSRMLVSPRQLPLVDTLQSNPRDIEAEVGVEVPIEVLEIGTGGASASVPPTPVRPIDDGPWILHTGTMIVHQIPVQGRWKSSWVQTLIRHRTGFE